MAAEKNYGQSLFERLYSQFRMMEHSPIMMLMTQYRMHQDICMFPNKHVYGGFLLTDPWVYLPNHISVTLDNIFVLM